MPKIKYYEISQFIGKGSFSKVYKGQDTRNGNIVALKCDTSSMKVLKHEVSILNYLYREGVKNIPKIYWYGNYMDNPSLVMSYYKSSLQDYFDTKGLVEEKKIGSIMIKCLDILSHLSISQVIHRDIKPQNFMIQDGELYLIDFGLATVYSFQESANDIFIKKEELVGTPRYSSYFSHCGEQVSPRDDLLSLGYVYYYLKYGSLPWDNIERTETDTPRYSIEHPENVIRRELKEFDIFSLNLDDKNGYNYFKYCHSLNCDDMPDYHSLMQIFIS